MQEETFEREKGKGYKGGRKITAYKVLGDFAITEESYAKLQELSHPAKFEMIMLVKGNKIMMKLITIVKNVLWPSCLQHLITFHPAPEKNPKKRENFFHGNQFCVLKGELVI